MECKWRMPLFIFLSITSVSLIIGALSTTYWVEKQLCDSKFNYHIGLFYSCLESSCSTSDSVWDDVSWSVKVKALLIVASIIGIVAVILNFLRLRWKTKVKAFITPVLMLIVGIFALSGVGVYGNLHGYIFNYDECKLLQGDVVWKKHLMEGLSYGYSFIIGCMGGALSICTSLFGIYTDFVDIFGATESQF